MFIVVPMSWLLLSHVMFIPLTVILKQQQFKFYQYITH